MASIARCMRVAARPALLSAASKPVARQAFIRPAHKSFSTTPSGQPTHFTQ